MEGEPDAEQSGRSIIAASLTEDAPIPESGPALIPVARRRGFFEWFAASYDAIIFAILLFEYLFIQLVFTTYTQNIVIMKEIALFVCPLSILSVWLIGDFARYGRFNLPRHGFVSVSVAALLFWGALVFASPSTPIAVYYWGFYFSLFVNVWAILKVLDSTLRLMVLLRIVLVTNVLMILYGLNQLCGSDVLVELGVIPDWGSNVFVSTYGSPNFFSGYMIVTVPLLVGYWFLTRNLFLRLFLPALVAVNLFEIVKSTARGAYMAMAWYLVLYPVLLVLGRGVRSIADDYDWKRILRTGMMILVMVALILAVVAPHKTREFGTQVYQQFYSLCDFEGNYTNWVRMVFFQMGIDGALRAPFFGRGLGSFNFQMPESRAIWYHRTGVSHNTDHPHNEHFEWLHDTGIFGLTFFWAILAAYGCLGLRGIRRHRGGIFYAFLISAFMGPWNEWWQSTFDVESRWTGPALTQWFSVGIVLAVARLPLIRTREELEHACAERRPAPPVPIGSEFLPLVIIACALPLYFLCYVCYDFWMADHHLRNNMAYTDANQGSVNSALHEAETARSLCYMNPSNYYKLAYTYLVAGQLEHAMNSYRDLQSFAPNYAQIHINLAFLNDQMGLRTASAWERDRAATIEHNTKNHRDAAQYWLQLGDSNRALAHLRHCFRIELDRLEDGYHFWYDHDNLRSEAARIYMQRGERTIAEMELALALQSNPNNVLAAVLLTQLRTEEQDHERTTELEEMLQKYAPANPALLLLKMSRAVASRDYATALLIADEASSGLPLPPQGGQPSQETAHLGNSLLSMTQVIFGAHHDQAKCFDIAGWVYATQGRYEESDQFLARAFMMTQDARTGERLGRVRAARKSKP